MFGSEFFQSGFLTVFETMTILFVISFFGWLGVKGKYINDDAISGLTRLLVDIITPAKLIVDITANLNGETFRSSSYMAGSTAAIIFTGAIYGYIATKLWPAKSDTNYLKTNNSIITMTAINNGIFLPLPLLIALTPIESQSLVTLYVSSAYLVIVLSQWTFGVTMLGEAGSSPNWKTRLKPLLNMPLLAIAAGIIFSRIPYLSQAAKGMDTSLIVSVPFDSARTLGAALSPVAMLTLGMMIARCELEGKLKFRSVLIPVSFRLFLAPLIVLLLIKWKGLHTTNETLALAILVEAAMPPATVLPIIAKRFGGDWETISAVLLVAYLLALFTAPIWIGLLI